MHPATSETLVQNMAAMEVTEDDMWIKDDPNGNPESLRFQPGSLVMYKMDLGWVEGEVVKVFQHLDPPPAFRGPNLHLIPPILYVVWPHTELPEEQYGSHWIHEDTDDFIRPRLEDATPNPATFNPVTAAPEDPLSYLYSGLSFNSKDENGNEMADSLAQVRGVNSATTNPDGTIRLNRGGPGDVLTYTIKIPEQPIHGVVGDVIIQFGQQLQKRKHHSGMPVVDLIGLFEASVPKESSLRQLEAASRTSPEKMLELGDALMIGFHGWPRDPHRACHCYKAAAWGCLEPEVDERIGIPIGVPEAMVAAATVVFTYIQKQIMGLEVWESVPHHRVISKTLEIDNGIRMLVQITFWLSMSVRRGHISPFAQMFARTLKEMDVINDRRIAEYPDAELIRNTMQPLLAMTEYRELELAFEKLQRSGDLPRGDPDDKVIEMFAVKSQQLLRDMPVSSDLVHIEYRQIPRSPFPMAVYAIAPKRRQLIKVVRLPDHLQMQAFTQESFEYAWLRILFELHLGNPISKQRTRPSSVSVLDTPGNQHFAQYLRLQFMDSQTQVRLATHEEPIHEARRSRRRSPQTLGDVVKHIENRLLEIPGFLIDEPSNVNGDAALTSSDLSEAHQIAMEIAIQHGNNQAEIITQAQTCKDQGNSLFGSHDFTGASRSYSVAIALLARLPNPNDEARLLLGTSLSNRAACFLDMETSRSAAFSKLMVQNAVRDCTAALKASWALRVLPGRILDKLKFRLDKGVARLDTLESDFQSEIAAIIFPPRADTVLSAAQVSSHVQTVPLSEEAASVWQPVSEGNEAVLTNAIKEVDADLDDMLLERGVIIYNNALAKNSKDGCPICLREFDGELSHVFCGVLPCGEHALCVECICRCKKQSDKGKASPQCPLCRHEFDGRIVQNSVYDIITKNKALVGVVEKFPSDPDESTDVAVRLMWRYDFNVDRVIDSMEEILDYRAAGELFSRDSTDLTHTQKQEIYEKARRPVTRLIDRRQRLMEERRTTFNTARLRQIEKDLRQVRCHLASARLLARDEIYEQLNSIGTMGAQLQSRGDDENAAIQVDFHGMHVSEMHTKYEELVEAILPVVKRVTIITGRGLHSPGGECKLMKALKKKIEKEKNTRWSKIPNNPGAINVTWLADA